METKAIKTGVLLASIAIAAGLNAQSTSDKQTKTCIKIHESINGKEINIDTCFTDMSADIEKRLADMGVTDMPDMDNMNGSMNMVVDDDADNSGKTKTEVIVIKHSGDDKNSNDKEETVNVTSAKSGKTCAYTYTISNDSNMTIDDGKDGGSTVTAKNSNGNVTIVTTGTTGKNTKVYVTKNVIVKNITDTDKKILPADASSEGTGFADLNIYPNPSDGTIAITYSSGSNEPLQVDVYDINGKKLEAETINNMKGQVNRTISLNAYGQGIYFVHLTQGKQSDTRKIIVKF